MNNIEWVEERSTNGVDKSVYTGFTEVRQGMYCYFIWSGPRRDWIVETLITGYYDNIDLEFPSLEEAKAWAECHYSMFWHEFKDE